MAELDQLDIYTQKAVDDPKFRAEVLKDANKAIKEEFGYEPPYKITYHISDKNHVVFCLPPEDGALDDNELSNVAGGVGSCGVLGKDQGIPQEKDSASSCGWHAALYPQSKKSKPISGYMNFNPNATLF